MNYRKEILNRLLDKYESSKTFAGQNAVRQSFVLHVAKEFPEYDDNSKISEIREIEEVIDELADKDLIKCRRRKNGSADTIMLDPDKLDDVYAEAKRKPKRDINDALEKMLKKYAFEGCMADGDKCDVVRGADAAGADSAASVVRTAPVVRTFSTVQLERLEAGKSVQHFNGKPDDYRKLLRVLDAVEKVDNEIYEREFSARVLGDSKAFEKMRSTVISILYEYGDYPDKECILGELNIIKNPGHVFFKGCGSLVLAGQEIDLSLLAGDIAISSADLKNIDELCATGNSVVTIENLTTFNSYKPDGEMVLYLGGYHNSVKRDFIRRMYEQNPDVNYYHYGDIDAGGLYILKHLRARTGVDFKPLHMDIDTLREKADYVRPLTANDVTRLKRLLLEEDTEFHELIKYMLAHNCKLEQET